MSKSFTFLFALVTILCLGMNLSALVTTEQELDLEAAQTQQDLQRVNQPAQDNSYYAGTQAGKNDVEANIMYACGGFLCGPFGVLGAAVLNTSPDPMVMNELTQTRGAAFANGYASGYSKESKKKNLVYAGVGWVISMAVSVIYSATAAEEDDYKHKTPMLGFYLPLGTVRPANTPQH